MSIELEVPELTDSEKILLKEVLLAPVLQKYLAKRKTELINLLSFGMRDNSVPAQAEMERLMHYKGMLLEVSNLKDLPNYLLNSNNSSNNERN